MATVTSEKVRLIKLINQELVEANHEPLNNEDFDILYDLSIDELEQTRVEVRKHMKKLLKQLHN